MLECKLNQQQFSIEKERLEVGKFDLKNEFKVETIWFSSSFPAHRYSTIRQKLTDSGYLDLPKIIDREPPKEIQITAKTPVILRISG